MHVTLHDSVAWVNVIYINKKKLREACGVVCITKEASHKIDLTTNTARFDQLPLHTESFNRSNP